MPTEQLAPTDDAPNKAALFAAAMREELARRRLIDFAKLVYPGFRDPPHIRLMAEYLERLEAGQLPGNRLLVAVSVRHGKSVLCSQIAPALWIGRNPKAEVVLASYSSDLAERNSRIAKSIVESDVWPFPDVKLARDSTAISRWNVVQGGGVRAIGTTTGITGRGADILVIDDPLATATSEADRDAVWTWYQTTIVPRLNAGEKVALISARFHDQDLAGRILDSKEANQWTVLRLPAICDSEDDPLHRSIGEALWPEHMSAQDIERRRVAMGSWAWSAQFQQTPLPAGDRLIKADWLQRYDEPPQEFQKVICALDAAAKTGVRNDYSAIVKIGATKDRYYLLDCWLAKVEFPALMRRVKMLESENPKPSAIYIEDTSNATALIQQLRQDTRLPIVPVAAKGSKESRVEAITGILEAKKLYLPREAPSLLLFEQQLLSFPGGRFGDDGVDALTIALSQLRRPRSEWSFAIARNTAGVPAYRLLR